MFKIQIDPIASPTVEFIRQFDVVKSLANYDLESTNKNNLLFLLMPTNLSMDGRYTVPSIWYGASYDNILDSDRRAGLYRIVPDVHHTSNPNGSQN